MSSDDQSRSSLATGQITRQLSRLRSTLRDRRDAGLDWNLRWLAVNLRKARDHVPYPTFSNTEAAPGSPRRAYDLGSEDPAAAVHQVLRYRAPPDEVRMLDRLWARYSHVWGAFDGVVQYAAALAGQAWMSTESPSEASRRVQALWEIAGRACLVAREISCLGRGGCLSGASARGRTLLELAVTADILTTCEPVVIRRYDLQLLRTSKMAATSYAEFAVELFGDSAAEDARDARESALKLANVIGENQENDSGAGIMNGNFWWARDEIRRRGRDLSANHNVSFEDLARATPLRPWLPFYRHFNRPIHAGPDGQADLYVTGPNGRLFLIGPTDSGYVDPAQVALHSLLHVLECLGGVAADELSPSVDLAPQLIVLRQSADEVIDALSDQDPRLNGEWLDSDDDAWLASDAGSNKRTG